MKGNRVVVVVVGPLSESVNGRTVVTRHVVRDLESSGADLEIFDVGLGEGGRTGTGRLKKAAGFLRVAAQLPFISFRRRIRFYLAVDNRLGLYLDMLAILLAGRVSEKIFLHHHAYNYIGRFNYGMKWLVRLAGRQGVHVVQCDLMGREFGRLYPSAKHYIRVSNAAWVRPADIPRIRPNACRKLKIGHLSNLTVDKGLGIVFTLFRALQDSEIAAELVLAGGAGSMEAAEMIESAVSEFGMQMDYRGPVYGDEKSRFFRDIDVFVFPTVYETETEGIVTLEALSFGVPVIAYGRGCIPGNLEHGGGISVSPARDFVREALPQLVRWGSYRNELDADSQAAFARSKALYKKSRLDLKELMEELVN